MAERPIKPGSTRRRAIRVQIYLWPQVEQDKVIHDIWKACQLHNRPQDVFRIALWRGLKSMMETGDLPPRLVQQLDLRRRMPAMMQAYPFPAYPAMPNGWPVPPMPETSDPRATVIDQSGPVLDDEPVRIEHRPGAAPNRGRTADPSALLGLLGLAGEDD